MLHPTKKEKDPNLAFFRLLSFLLAPSIHKRVTCLSVARLLALYLLYSNSQPLNHEYTKKSNIKTICIVHFLTVAPTTV